jgi:hypothetical protein
MRPIGAAAIASLILAVTGSSSEADFLLNCRLMSPDHAWHDRLCKGELGYLNKFIEECRPEAACIIRTQNFKRAYEADSGTVEQPITEVESTVVETISEAERLILRAEPAALPHSPTWF